MHDALVRRFNAESDPHHQILRQVRNAELALRGALADAKRCGTCSVLSSHVERLLVGATSLTAEAERHWHAESGTGHKSEAAKVA